MKKEYDIKKIYNSVSNHNCSICNKLITAKDVEINNCIATITGNKQKHFAHKTCLIRR